MYLLTSNHQGIQTRGPKRRKALNTFLSIGERDSPTQHHFPRQDYTTIPPKSIHNRAGSGRSTSLKALAHVRVYPQTSWAVRVFCPEPRKKQGDADSRISPSPAPASPAAAASLPRTPRAARPRQVPAEPRGAPAARGTGGGREGRLQTGGPAHPRRRPPAVTGKKGGRRKARLQGNKVFKRRGQRSERRAAPPPPAETAATS